MNVGQTVFSQLMDRLPSYEFQKCVERYRGDAHHRGFSCRDRYLAMAFAQLTYRESLRDIAACLGAMRGKLYHMGFRGRVTRSTLADANQARDWRIFADFAQVLIGIARPLHADDPMGVDLDQSLYALDSTTIDLCLSLFPWARFRKHKGAVKMHTLLDLHGNQFSRVHNSRGFPDSGEMTPIPCHQNVRAGGFSAFQKAIVPFVRRYGTSHCRHDQSAVLPDERQRFRNFFKRESELWPTQDGLIFSENRRRDIKPEMPVECKFVDAIFQPKRAEVR